MTSPAYRGARGRGSGKTLWPGTPLNYLIAQIVSVSALAIVFWRMTISAIVIYEFQKGLHYHDGSLKKVLGPGRYRFLKSRSRIEAYDMRPNLIRVPGQTVLTKDKISIKISLTGIYEIADPVTVSRRSSNYKDELYDLCQIAVREIIGCSIIDDLLDNRMDVDTQLLANVAAKADRIGVRFVSLSMRDIVLTSGLRKAFAAVLEAQKEAQRQLETARGEQAVLRSLANSSKMYENNPGLLQARIIQALSSGNNSIILGNDSAALSLNSAIKLAHQ